MMANATDNMTNYKNLEFKLFDCASQIKDIYVDKGLDGEWGAELDDILDRIRTRRFFIAVMGEFKRGKSTFINALLGTRVLPADVTPTTATLNRITYGDAARVTIRNKDGTEYEIKLNEIANYVTKLTEEGERRAAQIKEAVVAYPTVMCQNHIDILDTPGLNDDEAMTELSLDAASKVDAVILVLSALSPFSELEAKFAARLVSLANIHNIFFVTSFIDKIDEEERECFLENLKGRIRKSVKSELALSGAEPEIVEKGERILSGMKLLEISSTDALNGIISGDNKMLKASRLEALKGELFQFLTSTQGASLVRRSRDALLRHCENLQKINKEAADNIGSNSSRLAAAQKCLAEYQENWKQHLERRLANVRDISGETAKRINRDKNATAKEMMDLLKTNSNAALPIARLVAETNARVKSGLQKELLESLRNAAADCLGGFCSNERAVVADVCAETSMISVGVVRQLPIFDKHDKNFDVLHMAREPVFFWSALSAEAIIEAPLAARPALGLRSTDEAFSAYLNGWMNYINELCDEITSYARTEAEHLVPLLISSDRETSAANAAKNALALKAIEKEGRKLDEILATVKGIPEYL